MTISESISHFTNSLSEFLGQGEAASCARIAIEKITGIHYNEIRTAGNVELTTEQVNQLDKIIRELKTGRPLQYILNEAWFYGLPFYVDDRVLIPRPETEELVNIILKPYDFDKQLRVLDIGTGSGCIPVSLAHHKPHWEFVAIDVSKDALDVAVINAKKNNVSVKFHLLDILNESYTREFFSKQEPFDIIVSNPPYITIDEKKILSTNVLDFEPHTALFAHANDALVFYRRINELAGKLLKAGGQLYYEINEFKGVEMMDLMKKHNFNEVELINDINAKNRIIKAVK